MRVQFQSSYVEPSERGESASVDSRELANSAIFQDADLKRAAIQAENPRLQRPVLQGPESFREAPRTDKPSRLRRDAAPTTRPN